MLGQEKLKNQLMRGLGKSVILVGDEGSGKTTLVRCICENLGYQFILIDEISADTMRYTIDELEQSTTPSIYCFENFQEVTPIIQNMLLKTLEDSKGKSVFLFCVSSLETIISTVCNRSKIFYMERYTQEQLKYYTQTRCNDTDITYCQNPGDIQYKFELSERGALKPLIDYAFLIKEKIDEANISNVFKIVPGLEQLGLDARMAKFFLRILINIMDDPKKLHICCRYKYHLDHNNTDLKRLLEHMLVELRG